MKQCCESIFMNLQRMRRTKSTVRLFSLCGHQLYPNIINYIILFLLQEERMRQNSEYSLSSTKSKKYLICKQRLPSHASTGQINNIFNLTSDGQNYQQISNTPDRSRQYSQISLTISSSPSKAKIEPEKQLTLPFLSQSKYMTKPSRDAFFHSEHSNTGNQKIPKYLKDLETIDNRNLRKMRTYNRMWERMKQSRIKRNNNINRTIQLLEKSVIQDQDLNPEEISIVDRSFSKALVYQSNHDRDIEQKKNCFEFQTMLRNRHLLQTQNMKQKGRRVKQIEPLRGKGGQSQPIFEEMFVVEEVYKVQKNGKSNFKPPRKKRQFR